MHFFLQGLWENPEKAANRLGVNENSSSQPGASSSVRYAGKSLEVMLMRRLYQDEHKRLPRTMRRGKVKWTAENNEEPLTSTIITGKTAVVNNGKDDGSSDSVQAEMEVKGGSGNQTLDGGDTHTPIYPDIPTSYGVIVDLQSTPSSADSINSDLFPQINGGGGSGPKASLTPNIGYIHVAGTCPPLPSFPLHVTGRLFGPTDRYANFYHADKVDETTYVMTISTLLSRIAAASSHVEQAVVRGQLQTFVEEYTAAQHTNFYKILTRKTKGNLVDLPLVAYYHGIMRYCSFMSNACAAKKEAAPKIKRDPDLEEDELYASDEEEEAEYLADLEMNKVALEMFDHCEAKIDHNGLLRFPSLHVTFALVRLCRKLPSSAAEILSRSMDERTNRTPFDLVRLALEDLEENGLLHERQISPGDGSIHAGELEYLMYEAAQTFQECVKQDPLNVDNHCWHLAALSACLLLCCGNRIGSGARKYPSSRKRGFDQGELPWHEVRCALPKFENIRSDVARAARLLLHLARHQQGSRANLAMSSFLEWGQVICLLVGGATKADPWEEVRKLHKHHVLQWALQDSSLPAKVYFSRLTMESNSLTFRARNLENDPGDIKNWRGFIRALGPCGSLIDTEKDFMHKSSCLECMRLHDTLIVNHEAREEQRRQKGWWATERVGWWDSTLLTLPSTVPLTKKSRADRKEYVQVIVTRLQDSRPERVITCTDFGAPVSIGDSIGETFKEIAWLRPSRCVIKEEEGASPPSAQERSETLDSKLPQSFEEVIIEEEHDIDSTGCDSLLLAGPNAQTLELSCYKILIKCHLYNVLHPGVKPSIDSFFHDLAKKFENNSQFPVVDSDEWKCLLWLESMGLNVLEIIRND
jgi:hypothetical protein